VSHDWRRDGGRNIEMANVPLDLDALAADAPEAGESALPATILVGHFPGAWRSFRSASASTCPGWPAPDQSRVAGALFAAGEHHHRVAVNPPQFMRRRDY
jgi:catechol-2,3-dioxygenase